MRLLSCLQQPDASMLTVQIVCTLFSQQYKVVRSQKSMYSSMCTHNSLLMHGDNLILGKWFIVFM